jgi:hypothetical protein
MIRRFTAAETDRIRDMARRGYDGCAIGFALDRPAESIRSKAVALGVSLRPHSLDGRRIKLKREIWDRLAVEAHRLNMKPAKLARLIVESVVADDLFNAVLADLPRSMQKQ